MLVVVLIVLFLYLRNAVLLLKAAAPGEAVIRGIGLLFPPLGVLMGFVGHAKVVK